MTLQQEATAAIGKLNDDKLNVIIQFADFLGNNGQVMIERPSPLFFNVRVEENKLEAQAASEPVETSKPKRKNKLKFGLGKGIIVNVDKFDDYNDEIYDMFIGEES